MKPVSYASVCVFLHSTWVSHLIEFAFCEFERYLRTAASRPLSPTRRNVITSIYVASRPWSVDEEASVTRRNDLRLVLRSVVDMLLEKEGHTGGAHAR